MKKGDNSSKLCEPQQATCRGSVSYDSCQVKHILWPPILYLNDLDPTFLEFNIFW